MFLSCVTSRVTTEPHAGIGGACVNVTVAINVLPAIARRGVLHGYARLVCK